MSPTNPEHAVSGFTAYSSVSLRTSLSLLICKMGTALSESRGSTWHVTWIMVIVERVLVPSLVSLLVSVHALRVKSQTKPLPEQKQWMECPLDWMSPHHSRGSWTMSHIRRWAQAWGMWSTFPTLDSLPSNHGPTIMQVSYLLPEQSPHPQSRDGKITYPPWGANETMPVKILNCLKIPPHTLKNG